MKHARSLVALCLLAAGCAAPQTAGTPPAPQPSAAAEDASRRLDALAEAYYEEVLRLNPTAATSIGDDRYNHLYTASFSEENRAKAQELDTRYLAELRRIDRAALGEEQRLTYDVFLRNLESSIAGRRFPSHLAPVNQFTSFASSFAQLGSGSGIHPFRTPKDYDDFLSRMRGFEEAVDAAIGNMRQGIRAGVVQPRVLVERMLPQLAAHVVDDVWSSIFYQPVKNMPAEFAPEERARLTAAYEAAIRDRVVPAYRKLHDFVRDEYLPAARTSAGLSALPEGRAWYEHLARTSTTTDLTPEQIHQIGLAEVARIHREMDRVREQVGFQGTLPEFLRHLQTDPKFRYETREEMLADYRAAKARIDASTDRLFDIRPKADYEIRPVEAFRERSAAGGSYMAASPDGSRPGVFYLNTYDPQSRPRYGMESLLLHEGSPGHHFQISVQRELEHLPRIRRFGGFTAYSEGWGLYAESLGKELGLYTDPYQYYGALSGELWRAIRLVLDTGLHAKGWTREQAIDYARQNSSQSETSIVSEVERFMAIPGQALAYKIGQMKISELRRRAESELGPRFDPKAFHRVILADGALPLEVLEAKVERWIASQKG
ncbi:MAG TPA: DUF885 domain-containing protein [Longimicrobiaceae bacterium]|nr:DUF885 domain-containing protein [Longimicrobiaceae bacterium]